MKPPSRLFFTVVEDELDCETIPVLIDESDHFLRFRTWFRCEKADAACNNSSVPRSLWFSRRSLLTSATRFSGKRLSDASVASSHLRPLPGSMLRDTQFGRHDLACFLHGHVFRQNAVRNKAEHSVIGILVKLLRYGPRFSHPLKRNKTWGTSLNGVS